MKSKTITYGLIIIVVILFSVYFITLSSYNRDVDRIFSDIPKAVEQKDWSQTETKLAELNKLWSKVKYIVMLDYAEQDYANFSDSIVRLKSAVKLHDEEKAISEAMVCRRYWQNFTKIVPEP